MNKRDVNAAILEAQQDVEDGSWALTICELECLGYTVKALGQNPGLICVDFSKKGARRARDRYRPKSMGRCVHRAPGSHLITHNMRSGSQGFAPWILWTN